MIHTDSISTHQHYRYNILYCKIVRSSGSKMSIDCLEMTHRLIVVTNVRIFKNL